MRSNPFEPHPPAAPAVFEAAHVHEDEVPEKFYVPVAEPITDPNDEITLDLRTTNDGQVALLIFTSVEEMVQGCGDGQPWVRARAHQLTDLRELGEVDVVLVNAAIPEDDRRTYYQRRAQ